MSNNKSFMNVGEKRRRSGGTFRRGRDGDAVMEDARIVRLEASIVAQEAERERVRAYVRSDEWKAEEGRLVAQQEAVVAKLNASPDNAFLQQQWMALNDQLNGPMKQLERLDQEIQQDKAQLGQLRRPSDPNEVKWTTEAKWGAYEDENASCLIRDSTPWIQTGTKRLFVRPCYKDLYDLCMQSFDVAQVVFIKGAPGIGKSCFLDYALFRLRAEGKSILYLFGKKEQAYHFARNGSVAYTEWRGALRANIASDVDIVLYDPPEDSVSSNVVAYGFLCGKPCIVALSPDPENCKSLAKDSAQVRTELYMGPASLDEAHVFRSTLYPNFAEQVLNERFNQMGGILRYLFNRTIDEVLHIQSHALQNAMERSRLIDSGSVPKELKSLWSIYHLHPAIEEGKTNYRSFTISLCGDDIRARLRDALLKKEIRELWHLYNDTEDRHAGLKGIRFEAYAHRKLMGGFDGRAVRLGTVEEQIDVSIPAGVPKMPLENNNVGQPLHVAVEIARAKGAYLLPYLSNFPAVDSIYVPQGRGRVVLFQMKAGRIRPLPAAETQSIFDNTKSDSSAAILVWVVPHEHVLRQRVGGGPATLKQYRLVVRENQ